MAVAATVAAAAAAGVTAEHLVLTDLRITRLDSGLTVATERVPGTLSVATGVWVAVGARDEPAATSGVSHFLEHLLFKGTDRRSAIDISRAVDRYGGDINAYTSKESTAFYCRLPAANAQEGIELLGDVLTSPSIRPDDVETERQVILEEIAMDDDDPDDVAHRVFAQELFLDHPLGRDTAGEPETVERITAEDVREFFESRYTANTMVVSVAGPLDHDQMVDWVDRAFAGVREGGARPERTPPDGTGTSQALADDTEQVHLVLGGRAFGRTHPLREALDVVNHVLGGGISSRLFDEIRERRGLVYSVHSSVGYYADAGAYSISAGAQPTHAATVLELVHVELEKLRRDGITDEELDIARGSLTGGFVLGLEDTGSRMARNGTLLSTRGEIVPIADQVARWQAVDHDAVREVIDIVFSDEPLVVTLGPS